MAKIKRIAVVVALALIVVISLTLNKEKYQFFSSAQYVDYDKLQGSYSTTALNIPVKNNTYIVFDENGEYTLYRQFEILSQGTYTDDSETNTVTLSDGNSLNYNQDYKILSCVFDDTWYKFEKFSNTLVYINADRDNNAD